MKRPNKKKGGSSNDSTGSKDAEDNSKCRRVINSQTKGSPFMFLLRGIGLCMVLVMFMGIIMHSSIREPWDKGRYSLRMADKPELGKQAAQWLIGKAEDAIATRERFVVALSGGSMPKLLKAGMAAVPGLQKSTDWTKWHIVWADERCVDLDSDDSTFKAWTGFFNDVGIPSENVHNIDTDKLADPAAAATTYQEGLDALKLETVSDGKGGTVPELDVVMLGMGGDGHTASLFPGHVLLSETDLFVSSLSDSPKPPDSRITLTLPVLNSARDVAFLVTGAGKAAAVSVIMGTAERFRAHIFAMANRPMNRHIWGTAAANLATKMFGVVPAHPASLIRPKKGRLVWFLDTAAGADLPESVQQQAQNTYAAE